MAFYRYNSKCITGELKDPSIVHQEIRHMLNKMNKYKGLNGAFLTIVPKEIDTRWYLQYSGGVSFFHDEDLGVNSSGAHIRTGLLFVESDTIVNTSGDLLRNSGDEIPCLSIGMRGKASNPGYRYQKINPLNDIGESFQIGTWGDELTYGELRTMGPMALLELNTPCGGIGDIQLGLLNRLSTRRFKSEVGLFVQIKADITCKNSSGVIKAYNDSIVLMDVLKIGGFVGATSLYKPLEIGCFSSMCTLIAPVSSPIYNPIGGSVKQFTKSAEGVASVINSQRQYFNYLNSLGIIWTTDPHKFYYLAYEDWDLEYISYGRGEGEGGSSVKPGLIPGTGGTGGEGSGSGGSGSGSGESEGEGDKVELPNVSDTGSIASALTSVYFATTDTMKGVGEGLWQDDFWNFFDNIGFNGLEYFISVKKYPIRLNLTGSGFCVLTRDLKVGNKTLKIPTEHTDLLRQTSPIRTVYHGGSLLIPEYFGSFLDYAPHTTIQLYIAYIGYISVDPAAVLGKTITLTYIIDFSTGACCCMVKAGDIIIQYCNGTIGSDVPLISNNAAQRDAAVLGAIGTGAVATAVGIVKGSAAAGAAATAAGIATAPVGPIVAAGVGVAGVIGTAVSYAQADRYNIEGGKNIVPFINYSLPQTSYALIDRPKIDDLTGFYGINGAASNRTAKVKDCEGFTKLMAVNLDGLTCTESEKQTIYEILKGGIYV